MDFDVSIKSIRALARDVIAVQVGHRDGQALPAAGPGAHIDVRLPNGLTRQYSLTNALQSGAQATYEFAVGLDRASRGGSRYIHESLRLGAMLQISRPRNLFALDDSMAPVLLIAGGIGVTPIYAMARWCAQNNRPWSVVFAARNESRAAFMEEFTALGAAQCHFHFDEREGRVIDVTPFVQKAAESGAHIYCCGPAPFMAHVRSASAGWPEERLHFESFTGAPADASQSAFDLVLTNQGITLRVEAQESVLDCLERNGQGIPFSCRQGLCGTCEVRLVDGEPDHRDVVLSAEERAAGERFLPCVSRCKGAALHIQL